MSYIGKIPATGNFVKLDAISVVNGQASYTMQSNSVNFTPESANHMIVSLNGVIQAPQTSFSVSGSTITFASALSTGDVINFKMVYNCYIRFLNKIFWNRNNKCWSISNFS